MKKKLCGKKTKVDQCENWLCGKTAYKVVRDKDLKVHLWLSKLGKLAGLKITYVNLHQTLAFSGQFLQKFLDGLVVIILY